MKRTVIEHDVMVETRDGVALASDVYRPDTTEPVPAILMRTPYDKRHAYQYTLFPALSAVAEGFAVVVQDFRGRFGSGGVGRIPSGDGMDEMANDGHDSVQWVASQSWCSGDVGMAGASAVAAAQISAAWTAPPALKAIAPAVPGGGREKVMALETNIVGWTAIMAQDVIQRRMAEGADVREDMARVMAVASDPVAACWTLPLADLPTMTLDGMPTYEETVGTMSRAVDELWGRETSIDVPGLFISGWFDPTRTVAYFRAFRDNARTASAREGTRLIMGPWPHGDITWNVGEWGFGMSASPARGGVPVKGHAAFYRRHLMGDDASDLPTVQYFVMGSNTWKQAEDWPPPGTDHRRLFLRKDSGLSWDPPGAEAPDNYRYDPSDPVPSHGARVMYVGGSTVPGPLDQSRVERRADVLTYTTEALDRPVEIAGQVELRLFFSSSAVDTDVVAKLCVVDKDGNSVNIADGVLRARYREGWDTPTFLEPNEVYELVVDLGATAHRFEPGQRIRLQVTSSCFPLWDRNMNTGNPLGADAVGLVANQTVHHSAPTPSHLVLPVSPAT